MTLYCYCAVVPLRNCSLTHAHCATGRWRRNVPLAYSTHLAVFDTVK